MRRDQLEVLPAGSAERSVPAADRADPAAVTRDRFATLLAEVMGTGGVPDDSHFFDELGADSLVMAHFCARVRKDPDLPSVSMKDVYGHPTIRALASSACAAGPPPAAEPVATGLPAAASPEPAGRPHYVLCGVLQTVAFLGYAYLVALVATFGYGWIAAGEGIFDTYLRAVAFGLVTMTVLSVLPILLKWILVGRWTAGELRVWSLGYVRFWVVKTLTRSSPLVLFVGSPLYTLYLRALGAHIGRRSLVLSRSLPVCTDLLTVGDDSLVRKDARLSCYRASAEVIQTGTVTLGSDVIVSESTVLDIDTTMGDGSRLGHASALHAGQTVPAGEHWYGSPAQRGDEDFPAVPAVPCGTARRTVHGVLQLLTAIFVYVPLVAGGVDMLLAGAPQFTAVLEAGPAVLSTWVFYLDILAVSALVYFGAVPLALLLAIAPRMLRRLITPGKVYPLFGLHHGVHRAGVFLTNRRFLTRLFGDSSAVVPYLRALGYALSPVEQTGSNFGTQVKHESPTLSAVGTGTMVADGLSMMNADYSSTSFRVSKTEIGAHNFLGNRIAYPAGGRTGDDCLLATKVRVPLDGPLHEGVGLLGSPSFEIPRSVRRDRTFDDVKSGGELRRLLAAKNRHNVATMAVHLVVGWIYLFCVTLTFSAAADLHATFGVSALALANVFVLLFSTAYFVLVERAVTLLHPPGPLFCSIYDRRFWLRERYWKVPSENYVRIFDGTPFKGPVWRLLGVDVGRRLFDDGCSLTERTMVSLGDHCTLNAGSVAQCHSQEDGTFKSDRIAIGSEVTLGVGAFVHYGVTVGDAAVLEADSFLMKGEVVPRGAVWGGNPARPAGRTHRGDQGAL
ncbi:Pls/PosA family non-ribosomal peptide synthetase [Streptomyces sp. NPDC002057]|uniref:Pls/PosA family non-ribosomal peptide synthetase n=1 Tax=Streptomyces sp. NPDC002057 TaxID=3154664 RepID=UPI00331C9284